MVYVKTFVVVSLLMYVCCGLFTDVCLLYNYLKNT